MTQIPSDNEEQNKLRDILELAGKKMESSQNSSWDGSKNRADHLLQQSLYCGESVNLCITSELYRHSRAGQN